VDPSARVTGGEPALAGRVLLVDDEQRIVNFVRPVWRRRVSRSTPREAGKRVFGSRGHGPMTCSSSIW